MKASLTIIAAAMLLVGCATTPTPYYPPTDSASIVVTTEGYNGPHQVIKTVAIPASFPGVRRSNEEVCQELQRQGAALGADMVIDLHIEREALGGDTTGWGTAIKMIK